MDKRLLRDRNNKVIGSVTVKSDGEQEIRDHDNHRLGYYDPDMDTTYDRDGHRVGEGNLLTTLLDD